MLRFEPRRCCGHPAIVSRCRDELQPDRQAGTGEAARHRDRWAGGLRIALEAAGLGLKDLVKTTPYVTDIGEFFKHPEVRHEIFGQSLPTGTTVEVRRLSHPDMMVEVEAMAVIDQ